jgi:regulator of replication initiation timing
MSDPGDVWALEDKVDELVAEIEQLRADNERLLELKRSIGANNERLRTENVKLRGILLALRTDCGCEFSHEAARRALEEGK